MGDIRSSFVTLEDSVTQAGLPLHKALEGEAVLNKNAQGAFAFQDSSLNFVYPTLDSAGRLPVTFDSAGTACLTDEGGVVGTTAFQDLATITLTIDAVYEQLGFIGSCFRDAIYEVVWIDDVGVTDTETILATFRTGAGNLTKCAEFECMEFTAGASGVQELRIRAKQRTGGPASDIDGAITTFEKQ